MSPADNVLLIICGILFAICLIAMVVISILDLVRPEPEVISRPKSPRQILKALPEPPRGLKWTLDQTFQNPNFPDHKLSLRLPDSDSGPTVEMAVMSQAELVAVAVPHATDPIGRIEMLAPDYASAYSHASRLLMDFAYATGGLEHLPTWVGTDRKHSFSAEAHTSNGHVTHWVQIGPASKPLHQAWGRPINAAASENLELDMILSVWPIWAREHLKPLTDEFRKKQTSAHLHKHRVLEQRLRNAVANIARTPQETIDDQFTELAAETSAPRPNPDHSIRKN